MVGALEALGLVGLGFVIGASLMFVLVVVVWRNAIKSITG